MPRPSNTEERRRQIIEGLLSVMAKEGYENASIQAIGKASGLTPGLIHYHFKSKQEILVALIKTLSAIAQQRFEGLLAQAHNAQGRLEAFIDAALALGENANEDAVSAWVVISAEAIRQPEVRQLYQAIISGHKKEAINRLKDFADESGKSFTDSEIENFAMMMLAAIGGAYQLATTARELCPRHYASVTLKQFVFSLFQAVA